MCVGTRWSLWWLRHTRYIIPVASLQPIDRSSISCKIKQECHVWLARKHLTVFAHDQL